MKVLEQSGYTEYKPPSTKAADELWQKTADVAAGDGTVKIDAYVYYKDPKMNKTKDTVEFELYLEKENFCTKTQIYSFSDLSNRELQKIENKIKSIYICLLHI